MTASDFAALIAALYGRLKAHSGAYVADAHIHGLLQAYGGVKRPEDVPELLRATTLNAIESFVNHQCAANKDAWKDAERAEAERLKEAEQRPKQRPESPPAPTAVPATAPTEPAQPTPKRPSGPKAHAVEEWRRRDPLGATWRPRRKGKINLDIYRTYDRVPGYVTEPVSRALHSVPNVLAAYFACALEADYDGCFTMPARSLAAKMGRSRQKADLAFRLLLAAGLIRDKHSGGYRQATVYRLATTKEFDASQLDRAVAQAKVKRAEGATLRLQKLRPVKQAPMADPPSAGE